MVTSARGAKNINNDRHLEFDDDHCCFITWNSDLVPLIEGLCSTNPCRFEFSGFGGMEPETQGLKRPRSEQLSYFRLVSELKTLALEGFREEIKLSCKGCSSTQHFVDPHS